MQNNASKDTSNVSGEWMQSNLPHAKVREVRIALPLYLSVPVDQSDKILRCLSQLEPKLTTYK